MCFCYDLDAEFIPTFIKLLQRNFVVLTDVGTTILELKLQIKTVTLKLHPERNKTKFMALFIEEVLFPEFYLLNFILAQIISSFP